MAVAISIFGGGGGSLRATLRSLRDSWKLQGETWQVEDESAEYSISRTTYKGQILWEDAFEE